MILKVSPNILTTFLSKARLIAYKLIIAQNRILLMKAVKNRFHHTIKILIALEFSK